MMAYFESFSRSRMLGIWDEAISVSACNEEGSSVMDEGMNTTQNITELATMSSSKKVENARKY